MLNWCTRLFSLLASELHICSYQLFLIFFLTFLLIYRAINLSNLVAFLGNSANQAIELLIQKGVPESHIIFLNLISVSYFFLLISKMRIFLALSIYTDFAAIFLTLGPWGNPLCLQKVPILENSHLWDWCCAKRRISCDTGYGWVWWSLFWHRRLISDNWNVKIASHNRTGVCVYMN